MERHYKACTSIRCNTSECKKSTLRYNANPWTHALIGRCVQRGLIEGETTHHVTSTTHQTVTLICFLWSQHCNLIVFMNIDLNNFLDNMETQLFLPLTVAPFDVDEEVQKKCWLSVSVLFRRQERQRIDKITIHRCSWSNHIIFVSTPRDSVIY